MKGPLIYFVTALEGIDTDPDCGMKYIDRGVAFGKLKALSEGAKIERKELA